MEEWRNLPGYEGCYEVSDEGRVRSVTRINQGRDGTKRQFIGRLLKPAIRPDGYLTVTLARDGDAKAVLVHRLILLAFRGVPPDGLQGCHNDSVKSNNRLSNLRWDTPAANAQDKLDHGTVPRGECHRDAKLTADQVREIRRLRAEGRKLREIAELFPVGLAAVHAVCKGRNWALLDVKP